MGVEQVGQPKGIAGSVREFRSVSRGGLPETEDPIMHNLEAFLVDGLVSEHGHMTDSGAGGAEVQRGAVGGAGLDESGIYQVEMAFGWSHAGESHLVGWGFDVEVEVHATSAGNSVTMGAIDVEPGTGSGFELGRLVVRVGRGLLFGGFFESTVYDFQLLQTLDLALVVELSRCEAVNMVEVAAVASHAFFTTVKTPGLAFDDGILAFGGDEVGIGLCFIPAIGVAFPESVKMEDLGFHFAVIEPDGFCKDGVVGLPMS